MLIKSIDHFTINVKDVAKSIRFYEDVFSFEKVGFIDMGDHQLYYMGLPGECRLELIVYNFEHEDIQTKETNGGIYRHIALVTDDLNEIQKRCDNYNVKIKQRAAYNDKLNFTGMLIEDPNGVEIEIIERA